MIILETDRLLFRDHESKDLDAFCAMEADPKVRRYVGGAPRTREEAESRFEKLYLPPAPYHPLGLWATLYKPDDCYIGYCGLYEHLGEQGPISGEGVLAFYLASSYWGRGLATEAGRAFIDFGFNELGLTRIVTGTEIGNDASVRVLEKLGMKRFRTDSGPKRSFYGYELTR